MSTIFVCFWKSIHALKEHMSFVWIYSQLQIHTMLYVFTDFVYIFSLKNGSLLHAFEQVVLYVGDCDERLHVHHHLG